MFLHCIIIGVIFTGKIATTNLEEHHTCSCRKSSDDFWFHNLLPSKYNKHQQPFGGQSKTSVQLSMNPISILDLSPKKMKMSLEAEFCISWKDSRLNHEVLVKNLQTASTVQLPTSITRQLWTPQLQLGNCKKCENTLHLTDAESFYYNNEDKTINAVLRLTTTYTCYFNMSKYPFDKQKCSVVILSPNNPPLSLKFDTPEEFDKYVINELPEYELYAFTSNNCSYNRRTHSNCHSYNFKLRRSSRRSILLIFIPSAFFVIISWISFWLDPEITNPRVFIGFTTLLILIIEFNYVQLDLSSTITALDIWNLGCISFVLASVFEFAYVNYKMRKIKRICARQSIMVINTKQKRKRNRPKAIDNFSKYAFPLIYIVFNIAYWSNYYP